MQLSVLERLVLSSILPGRGDFTTVRIVRDLQGELSFSEAEHAELGITVDPETGSVSWDNDKATDKDIELGGKATAIIVETLERMDKEQTLEQKHLSLYEKFMEGDNR